MRAIAYYRVSTVKQGQSGLGLDAQRDAVTSFLRARDGKLIAEFTEIESGKRNDRPQLAEAILHCRITGSTLVIAKLDRLARNVNFVSGLMDSRIAFIACDMPEANELTVNIMASFAQHEAKAISARTKAALAAAKARGTKLGCPLGAAPLLAAKKGNSAAVKKIKSQADDFVAPLKPAIVRLWQENPSVRKLTAALNNSEILTRKGGRWHVKSVQNLLTRLKKIDPSLVEVFKNKPVMAEEQQNPVIG